MSVSIGEYKKKQVSKDDSYLKKTELTPKYDSKDFKTVSKDLCSCIQKVIASVAK